jgi:hypothetical protein
MIARLLFVTTKGIAIQNSTPFILARHALSLAAVFEYDPRCQQKVRLANISPCHRYSNHQSATKLILYVP